MPTPNTQELFLVVTNDAVGAPAAALAPALAPVDKSEPVKVTTVMDDTVFCARLAVTVTLFKAEVAKDRQISASPGCAFVRRTRVQFKPAPATLVTVWPPEEPESAEMNASNSSFGAEVEKAAVVTVVLADALSPETTASIANGVGGGAAFTARVALLVAPYEAEISAEVFSVTTDVRIVNVADVAPERTVTLAGTCAAPVLLLDNSTVAPVEGAAAFKVTVPVDEIPPTTVVGLRVTELRFSKLTVNPADCFVP